MKREPRMIGYLSCSRIAHHGRILSQILAVLPLLLFAFFLGRLIRQHSLTVDELRHARFDEAIDFKRRILEPGEHFQFFNRIAREVERLDSGSGERMTSNGSSSSPGMANNAAWQIPSLLLKWSRCPNLRRS